MLSYIFEYISVKWWMLPYIFQEMGELLSVNLCYLTPLHLIRELWTPPLARKIYFIIIPLLKFVHCEHMKRKLSLFVPQYKSEGSSKTEMSNLKILRFINFHVFDPKFV